VKRTKEREKGDGDGDDEGREFLISSGLPSMPFALLCGNAETGEMTGAWRGRHIWYMGEVAKRSGIKERKKNSRESPTF